jgi:hypothetical protein
MILEEHTAEEQQQGGPKWTLPNRGQHGGLCGKKWSALANDVLGFEIGVSGNKYSQ